MRIRDARCAVGEGGPAELDGAEAFERRFRPFDLLVKNADADHHAASDERAVVGGDAVRDRI